MPSVASWVFQRIGESATINMGGGRGESGRLDFPICECKKVLNISAPVKLLFSCMIMWDCFFLKASSRCVGVCRARDIYIYTPVWGYIYIFICFYLLSVAWCCSVFRFARALRLDVHGFGFWKNKLHLSVLIELYFSFSQKEAESSF